MNKVGTLFLIPCSLGDNESLDHVIPPFNNSLLENIDLFIVENERSARRFLRKCGYQKEFNLLTLNKHTEPQEKSSYLDRALKGINIGLLSEAGCPGIADPGAEIVALAHQKNIRVKPLVGPSSIFLALMGSGFNGQNFAFHGYLPKERKDRNRKLKELENNIRNLNQTQIFIETPFRNMNMLEDILQNCDNHTELCIACDLTCESELIQSKSISEWKKKKPDINKRPAIFLLYKF